MLVGRGEHQVVRPINPDFQKSGGNTTSLRHTEMSRPRHMKIVVFVRGLADTADSAMPTEGCQLTYFPACQMKFHVDSNGSVNVQRFFAKLVKKHLNGKDVKMPIL